MKGILGRKVGMVQLFDEQGNVTAVTVIEAGPCYVTQIKVRETDGYDAIQLGFGEVKQTKLTRPRAGHLGLLNTSDKHPVRRQFPTEVPSVRYLREFRTGDAKEYDLGSEITVDVFEVGDQVDVVGKAKGRGFAGVMKRHGFGGGPATHGQSDRQRSPGSIGATSTPGRVFKGMRMPGRMARARVRAWETFEVGATSVRSADRSTPTSGTV